MTFAGKLRYALDHPILASGCAIRRLDALLRYRGRDVTCPCCGRSFGGFKKSRCPRCDSGARHRTLWLHLAENASLYGEGSSILHFAPEDQLIARFAPMAGILYITADIDPSRVRISADMCRQAFPDGAFDLLISSHVLEHVGDDRLAMREMLRVLKPGGTVLLMVPLDTRREFTFEDPRITDPKEREEYFGQDDHVRVYGRDFVGRLEKAGFEVEVVDVCRRVGPEASRKHGLLESDLIYSCRPAARRDPPQAGCRRPR
jgi:SAM-dependent methyltransferase